MRFYTGRRGFYCGIHLHARSIYVCVLSYEGKIVYHANMPAGPEPFLKAIAPYRPDVVVGAPAQHPSEIKSGRVHRSAPRRRRKADDRPPHRP